MIILKIIVKQLLKLPNQFITFQLKIWTIIDPTSYIIQ